MKFEDRSQSYNRRRFLEQFAALGLASVIPAAGVKGAAPESAGKITAETIAEAEKLIGIEFTPEERRRIAEMISENLEAYRALRAAGMDETVFPAMVFNPVPAGAVLPTERLPFVHSRPDVKKPGSIEEAAYLSVVELAALLETRQISSMDLTKMYLARLKRYDPTLRFVINLTEELALRQAERADKEIASGKYRGPLHGIPYGIKDSFSVKGYPTTWGAEPFRDRTINRDATVAEKLEEAGAVLLAKLSMGRLATGDEWFGGTTKNPWDPQTSSGGSSAGPAAATVAGCIGFAIGTETYGSMITPCAICGVTGLRPTFGRVSRYGVMTMCWSQDKVAPICRSAEDCALVLQAIMGPDGRDNSIIDTPFNWDYRRDFRKLRIGFNAYNEKELEGEEDAEFYRAVCGERLKALDVLRKLGAELIPLEIAMPESGERMAAFAEAAAAHDDFTRGTQDDLVPSSRWPDRHRRSRFIPAVEYLHASRYRSVLIDKMAKAMRDVDLYAEITWPDGWQTNYTGHPALIIPCGFVGRKPATITFIGRLFGEADLICVAKAFQDATDFHRRHPEL
ncbi:MAG TPA: amidase [Candidatus Desulfaltia sp.]|nr:amidase [Candidatus Desulfaltia sp.]